MELAPLGKAMVLFGAGAALLGGIFWVVGTLAPGLRLGRLPGDVVLGQGATKVFIPITTMILASALLTLVLWLAGVLRR